ncbi:MAG: HNH endonuclease, partial [Pseudomonadota bacterium]|nr:HNH endonuclease [Pseudomonadota bacterium]
MWRGEDRDAFRKRHSLTPKQVRWLQCTAEHVVARCDGGTDSASNIVAACLRCNRGRHARSKPLEPSDFSLLVRKRVR